MSLILCSQGRNRRRQGNSLMEVVLSTLIVGVLMVGALRGVGSSSRASLSNATSGTGLSLAEELMGEILNTSYSDPDETPLFGPEGTESSGTRADFDDVDDYHNWTGSPPKDKNGSPQNNSSGWERRVVVEFVDPNDLTTAVGSDQGVKRITVTVTFNGVTQAELVQIVTDTES